MKKLILILAAVLCLAACEDKSGFTYDKVYDDPDIFNLPIKMDAPTKITENGAVFKVMLKTKEEIIARGVLVSLESFSNNPAIFYSDETGNVFEVEVTGLRAGTEYYARSFILTAKEDLITSLERKFTTRNY